jgi:hypothetical protein
MQNSSVIPKQRVAHIPVVTVNAGLVAHNVLKKRRNEGSTFVSPEAGNPERVTTNKKVRSASVGVYLHQRSEIGLPVVDGAV